jgi:hypothetical protein
MYPPPVSMDESDWALVLACAAIGAPVTEIAVASATPATASRRFLFTNHSKWRVRPKW